MDDVKQVRSWSNRNLLNKKAQRLKSESYNIIENTHNVFLCAFML